MKIFAIYTDINLLDKPSWFDEFRRKYDKSWKLHLTLIQPRYIDESDIEALKQKVGDFLISAELAGIPLFFNDPIVSKDDDGIDIFLYPAPVTALITLQKQLRNVLVEYNNFVNLQSKEYEIDFKPHITIGRSLTEVRYAEA